jgi:hypothetical protein
MQVPKCKPNTWGVTDLSRSDVDDCVGGVEEWSSKDDGYIIFFFSHI